MRLQPLLVTSKRIVPFFVFGQICRNFGSWQISLMQIEALKRILRSTKIHAHLNQIIVGIFFSFRQHLYNFMLLATLMSSSSSLIFVDHSRKLTIRP